MHSKVFLDRAVVDIGALESRLKDLELNGSSDVNDKRFLREYLILKYCGILESRIESYSRVFWQDSAHGEACHSLVSSILEREYRKLSVNPHKISELLKLHSVELKAKFLLFRQMKSESTGGAFTLTDDLEWLAETRNKIAHGDNVRLGPHSIDRASLIVACVSEWLRDNFSEANPL